MQAWLPAIARWNNRRLAERIDYEKQIHHRRYDRKCNLCTHSGGHAGHLSGSKKHECQCPLFPRNSLWILL